MPRIDRTMARALTEAGYMPLGAYLEMFADAAIDPAMSKEPPSIGTHRTRPWSVPAHFASPIRTANYRMRLQKKRAEVA